MEPERWQKIEQLFHSALNVEESRRSSFLQENCGGDQELRLKVESLLAHHKDAATFLESPAVEVAARELPSAVNASSQKSDSTNSRSGRIVSHYRIIEKLGGGGMGVVFKAEDIQLGRLVALKFLSEPLAGDSGALQRFQREARAASAPDHPNICTIYEIGQHAGLPFIAMQYLEGQSLDRLIAGKPLPLDQVISIGIQIADALEAVHAMGIIHRDIKPSNIYITKRGHPKILDFGVAKLTRDLHGGVSGSTGKPPTTVDGLFTAPGAQIGTFAYMSPEQEQGEELDARSDLFSFGLLLYDMATGWHSFSDKVAAVIHDAVGSQQAAVVSAPTLAPGLGNIIAKATQVDRNLRYQSAAEMRADLERIRTETAAPPPKETVKTPTAIATAKPRRWKWPVSAAAAALALPALGYFYFHRAPKLTDKDTIVLAEFSNSTGDPVFDDTLRQGLAVQLEQSPYLSLISDQRIQRTLQLMGRPSSTRLTPELAREICERTTSAAVLEGTIATLGSQYVLGLRAKSCRNGNVLDDEQVQAARKEDVLNSLTQIASKFRTRVGESLATVEKHDTPLIEATTPSLEALKAYSMGWRTNFSNGSSAAAPFLKRAIEIDPKFAMAHALLGLMYSNIGESVLSSESTTKAYELRERTSDRERFFIEAMYERQVTGNLERARQALELWVRTYPRDVNAHGVLSGLSTQGTGKYEQSIEEAKMTIALDPDHPFAYANLANSNFSLDRLTEAERSLQRAAERKLEVPEYLLLRYYIAFAKGDRAGMEREMALSRTEPGAEDWVTHSDALVLARSGQLQQAGAMSQRAVDLAEQAGQQERAATYVAGKAVWEALYGNVLQARRDAAAALVISKGRDVEYSAAFALALSGDFSRSQALADDLEKRFPEDTSVRFNYLPALRGVFALQHREPQKAIELLQSHGPYEFAVPGITFFAFFGSLYPAYVRGEAYLALHQGAAAATEFQKILDHRGLVFGDPVGALAHLQIGRAYAMQGDTAKAKVAYQDFLAPWKDADPDIPILKQAKAEYARLK